jgi:DNA polymerase III subunit epsilon
MLSAKPKWKVGIDCYERVIYRRKLLIYNYAFDYQAIQNTYQLHSILFDRFSGECVMHWYSQFIGEWDARRRSYRWQKLPGGDHSALGDCIATLELIKLMARSIIVEDLVPDGANPFAEVSIEEDDGVPF